METGSDSAIFVALSLKRKGKDVVWKKERGVYKWFRRKKREMWVKGVSV